MRLAFVDARQKTILFRAVADRLTGRHSVLWLIQDHTYARAGAPNQTVLPYPRARERRMEQRPSPEAEAIRQRVAASDRVILTFGRGGSHYDWYAARIADWLDEARPDVIFGEAGSFHSHLTALLAQARGIPFLNPLSSRYPAGRFAFFSADRLVPVGGSGESWPEQQVDQTIDDVLAGRRPPDYMLVKPKVRSKAIIRSRATLEWVRGERYTAQSPAFFVSSLIEQRRVRRNWNNEAAPGLPPTASSGPRVLYPLQLQPEMNLDVWGYEFRDQVKLVQELAERVSEGGGELWVKPNPKSSFELSRELLNALRSAPNAHLLSTATKMSQVVDEFDLVVTVSGTIAIERLFARRPVAVLLRDYSDWLGLPPISVDSLLTRPITRSVVDELAEAQVSVSPQTVLAKLVATSYPGQISEPDHTPSVLEPRNVDAVANAMEDVLSKLPGWARDV